MSVMSVDGFGDPRIHQIFGQRSIGLRVEHLVNVVVRIAIRLKWLQLNNLVLTDYFAIENYLIINAFDFGFGVGNHAVRPLGRSGLPL